MIVFDNDVAVKYLREGNDAITAQLAEYRSEAWALPSLVCYEFLCHYDRQAVVKETKRQLVAVFDEILPLTATVAVEATRIENTLGDQKITLPTVDLLNLATAQEARGTFVTHNARDFDAPPLYDLVDLDVIVT